MKILFDTNIVLDVLLSRPPWAADAEVLWRAGYGGRFLPCLAATSITNIFYIARRHIGRDKTLQALEACLDALSVLPVDGTVIGLALPMPGADVEDNVQIACASRFGIDLIVTHDPRGFATSAVQAVSPSDARARLGL